MRALCLYAAALALVAAQSAQAQQPARGAGITSRTPPGQSPAARPAPRAETPVPFRVGETLTYDVAWSQYLVAGTAVSRVVEKRPSYSSTAYYLVAEGRPIPLIARLYSLYYKLDSLLDSATALSQRSSFYSEEGTNKRFESTMFNRGAERAEYQIQADPPITRQMAVPRNVQDGLATLYALRGRAFKAGEHLTIPVADQGSLYTASFEVTGPESIKVPLGTVTAWKIGRAHV